MTDGVRRSRLGPGLRVVTETLGHLHSVALGVWVASGARDEADHEAGTSHFLEHLLFKGTPTRRAREVAEAIEAVGGDMNAHTSHEHTAYYVRVPAEHLALALDVLGDVVWHPALRPPEVESERQVILEEIGMREDAPEDLVHDLLASAVFPGHPLGREVVGTAESVRATTADDLGRYHAAHYRPANAVLAAAGAVDHDELVARLAGTVPDEARPRPPRPDAPLADPEPAAVLDRPTELVHLAMAWRAPAQLDPDRYAVAVLEQALGGGMSSRLFQAVREERGLAYSVYSYRATFAEAGMLGVYAGTVPARLDETRAVVAAEVHRLVEAGTLEPAELDAAKQQLRGGLVLGLETASSRMRRLAHAELVEGDVPPLDEIVRRIDAVGADDVARVVDRVLRDVEPTVALVGPVSSGAVSA